MQVGASVEQDTAYPGWAPNPGSAVVKLAQEVLTEVTGHEAKVGALAQFWSNSLQCNASGTTPFSERLLGKVHLAIRRDERLGLRHVFHAHHCN